MPGCEIGHEHTHKSLPGDLSPTYIYLTTYVTLFNSFISFIFLKIIKLYFYFWLQTCLWYLQATRFIPQWGPKKIVKMLKVQVLKISRNKPQKYFHIRHSVNKFSLVHSTLIKAKQSKHRRTDHRLIRTIFYINGRDIDGGDTVLIVRKTRNFSFHRQFFFSLYCSHTLI